MPGFFAALAPALLGAAGGLFGAREQRRAAEAANRPQPYEHHETRAPWAPAMAGLESIPELALTAFQNRLAGRPPPMMNIRGPSPAFRELAEELRRRALESRFVPQAQEAALGMMNAPSPLLQGVYDRAMSFTNPFAERLFGRGMGEGFVPRGDFQSMIANLASRGPAAPPLAAAPPMTVLPNLPPIRLPEAGSYGGAYHASNL